MLQELDEVPSLGAPVAGRSLPRWAWRWVGIVVGAAVGAAVAASGPLGRGLLLAAPAFALSVVLGVLAGEMSGVRRVPGPHRVVLEVRRLPDYLPKRMSVAVTVGLVGLAALLTTATVTASSDDLGRAGRALTLRCSPQQWSTASPWPGSYYSLPLALAVLLGLAAAATTLRRVVLRARPTGAPAPDDVARRQAAATVVGACAVLVAVPLLGTTLVSANVLLVSVCAGSAQHVLGWGLLALLPAWIALFAAGALQVVTPAGRAR